LIRGEGVLIGGRGWAGILRDFRHQVHPIRPWTAASGTAGRVFGLPFCGAAAAVIAPAEISAAAAAANSCLLGGRLLRRTSGEVLMTNSSQPLIISWDNRSYKQS
jgi:hypothetical protein